MALSLSVPDPCSGEVLPAAYARIGAASLDVATERAAVSVLMYRSAAARAAGRQPMFEESYMWDAMGSPAYTDARGSEVPGWPTFAEMFGDASTASANIIQISYEALKASVPKFANAQDV